MAVKKHSIGKSLITGCVLFTLLYGVVLGAIGYCSYRDGLYQTFNTYLEDLIGLTLTQIDGDDLATCIETQQTSPAYDKLQAFLDDVRATYDVDFIYVVLPLRAEGNDNMMDVIAGVSDYEREYMADQLTYLGHLTGDYYPAEVAQRYLDCYRSNKTTVDFFVNMTFFGREYTALRTIQDSRGNAVAVLAADMSAQGIADKLLSYLVFHVIVTLVLTALFGFFMYQWLRRRVVTPLNKITDSVSSFVRNSHNLDDTNTLLLDDPQIHTGDEFEELADSIVTLSDDIKTYLRKMLSAASEAERMRDRAQEMGRLALVDQLTGVRNRVSYAATETELDGRIEAGEAIFGIAMFDLNNLKGINDSYGHDRGDIFIKTSCKLVCEVFQHSPVFRVGGDEFLAVLVGHDLEHAEELLHQVRLAVIAAEQDASLEPWERASVACGMAVYDPEVDVSTANVLQRADQNMYEDKRRHQRESAAYWAAKRDAEAQGPASAQ